MVYLLYATHGNKLYFDGVYEKHEEAYDKKLFLSDSMIDIQYNIIDLQLWKNSLNKSTRFSEEDSSIEEEDYYNLLGENSKLTNIIKKQQNTICTMESYISFINYSMFGLIGITLCGLVYAINIL